MRAGVGEAGSAVTPQLVNLDADSRAHLDGLFDRDPVACQEYLESELKDKY